MENFFGAFFYLPRSKREILRNFGFILPKFHFILPKFCFVLPKNLSFVPWGLLIISVEIAF